MASFGHLAPGATGPLTVNADVKLALRVVAPEDGVTSAIWADLVNNSTEIQAWRAGIYSDAVSPANSTLLDSSNEVVISPGATRRFFQFSGLNAQVFAGNVYWLALQAGAAGGSVGYYYDAGAGRRIISNDGYADGMSSSFGTITSDTSNSPAFYADYTATANIVPGLKRIVLGRIRAGV